MSAEIQRWRHSISFNARVFLSSGAEGTPAALCGREQRAAWARLHQDGPPPQAGGADPLPGQRLEGCLGARGGPVRRPRGVQHGLVSREEGGAFSGRART